MQQATLNATAVVVFLAFSSISDAQWVNFSDETAARLSLQPFSDNPAGDPLLDAEEKDIGVADLDNDGDEDVVAVRKREFSNPGRRQDVLLMNENGTLVDRTAELAPGFIATTTDARDVILGDFTGDGWEDLVVVTTFGDQPRFYRNAGEDGLGNWLGLVDETDLRLPVISVPQDTDSIQFCAGWGGDVTGSGDLDIYLSNYKSSGGTNDILLVNDGNGFFTNETEARLGQNANVAFGTSVEIHDMDNDGDNDIVKISTLYAAAPFPLGQFILFNDGNGVFDTIPFQAINTVSPYMFAIGDLNNDGLLDQYLEDDQQDRVAIVQSAMPDGPINYVTTTLTTSPRTTGFGGNTKLYDIDDDGDLDAAVGPIDVDIANCGSSGDFALLRNDGSGTLSDPWASNDDQNFHTDPHDFAFLDVNGDGCGDIVMGLCTGWRVFIQSCAAAGLTLGEASPGIPVVRNDFQVSGASPNRRVRLFAGSQAGSATVDLGNCQGITLNIGNPRSFAGDRADANGEATLTRRIPAVAAGKSILFQAVDSATCTVSNLVQQAF